MDISMISKMIKITDISKKGYIHLYLQPQNQMNGCKILRYHEIGSNNQEFSTSYNIPTNCISKLVFRNNE